MTESFNLSVEELLHTIESMREVVNLEIRQLEERSTSPIEHVRSHSFFLGKLHVIEALSTSLRGFIGEEDEQISRSVRLLRLALQRRTQKATGFTTRTCR